MKIRLTVHCFYSSSNQRWLWIRTIHDLAYTMSWLDWDCPNLGLQSSVPGTLQITPYGVLFIPVKEKHKFSFPMQGSELVKSRAVSLLAKLLLVWIHGYTLLSLCLEKHECNHLSNHLFPSLPTFMHMVNIEWVLKFHTPQFCLWKGVYHDLSLDKPNRAKLFILEPNKTTYSLGIGRGNLQMLRGFPTLFRNPGGTAIKLQYWRLTLPTV